MLAGHLPGGSTGVDDKVGEVQRPPLTTGPLHQARTVHHRAAQPVHLGHQQSGRLAGTHRIEGGEGGRAAPQ